MNDIWVLKATATGPLHWRKVEAKGIAPEARHGHSAAVADTNIIFFGGRGPDNKKLFDDLFMFDCVNELWYLSYFRIAFFLAFIGYTQRWEE